MMSYAKNIADMAKEGAKIAKEKGILQSCGKMCDTCAFKCEQDHILTYFLAADLAAKKLMEGGQFSCHTWDFKCADKPCAGFQLAKLAYEPSDK
jgi:hypothetical protein